MYIAIHIIVYKYTNNVLKFHTAINTSSFNYNILVLLKQLYVLRNQFEICYFLSIFN